MELLTSLENWFFDKNFWLAENVTWKELENHPGDGVYKAQPADLWRVFPAAVLIFVARYIFESGVAAPFARYMGISEKRVCASPNPILEKLYKTNPYPDHKEVEALSKDTDLSEKQIQRWFRRRRNQDRPTVLTKFTETSWRCFFYLTAFLYGLYTVSHKSYFWDIKDCWRGHPRQHVPDDVYWYYIVEIGFYVSLLFSQFADVQRKDFWEQFVHHIATICLLCFSWFVNYVRVGALILCLHDAADYFLEGAKLFRYLERRTLCDIMFGVFTLTWLVSRLMYFPYVILWTVAVDAAALSGFSYSLYVFNVLLWILQVLHVFWFVLIVRVAVNALTEGKVEKDVRSASEESGEESVTSENVSTSSQDIKQSTSSTTNGSSRHDVKCD